MIAARRRAPLVLLLLAAAGIAAGALAAGLRWRASAESLPRFFAVPDFTLVERSGRPATLVGLRGRPWIAGFIFTRCSGVCPRMTSRMSALSRSLEGEGVRFVSFSVDPVHDTPEVLARYASLAGAGADWWFVTGPLRDLHALSTGGFKLAAMEAEPGSSFADGPFLHSSKLVLVDAEGVIRG